MMTYTQLYNEMIISLSFIVIVRPLKMLHMAQFYQTTVPST
jgi:hypothetical protein